MTHLDLKIEKIEDWDLHALEFENDKEVIRTVIPGQLINIQTKTGKKENKKLEWQQKIAKKIKSDRGSKARDPSKNYAISLGLKFSQDENQNQPLDVDNFIKPIFAGIAAGLFSLDEIPSNIIDFKDFPDSCFRYLYVERLDEHAEVEGVAVIISEET